MDGLLHLVQRGGAWACCGPAQSSHRCNSPPINGQCTNHCIVIWWSLLCGFNVAIKGLTCNGWNMTVFVLNTINAVSLEKKQKQISISTTAGSINGVPKGLGNYNSHRSGMSGSWIQENLRAARSLPPERELAALADLLAGRGLTVCDSFSLTVAGVNLAVFPRVDERISTLTYSN